MAYKHFIILFILDITAGSPYIAQELSLLKKAFTDERTERLKLQSTEMKKILNQLTPIYVPQSKDNRITELEYNLTKAKKVSSSAGSKIMINYDFILNFRNILCHWQMVLMLRQHIQLMQKIFPNKYVIKRIKVSNKDKRSKPI